ncbi:MAG: RseC/MucC family positive regulator of sigma(E) [Bacteroidales bacterium]|nr:RseC/MucC family positive regulator of sigma(E) [Bacteroidales bacterium]
MADKKSVSHKGTVIEITEGNIKVEIINKSMCAACHAKGFCSAGDTKDKIIDVAYYNKGEYSVGDEVEVVMKKSMGFKAVWISYVIPLAILLIFLLTLHCFNLTELQAGLSSILAVAVYYLVIYMFREKIADKFVFTIAKNNI